MREKGQLVPAKRIIGGGYRLLCRSINANGKTAAKGRIRVLDRGRMRFP